MRPTVFIVSEGLVAPPKVGFHIHLLAIAHALAAHVNVRALVWTPERGTPAWSRWLESLPGDVDPDTYLRPIDDGPRHGNAFARKVRCWQRAQQLIENEARPGDVLWIRELPTALFGIPALTRWMTGRRDLRYLYDVASIVELEMGLASDVRFARQKIGVERWLRPRFDIVRTLGEGMANFLSEHGVPREKILVAPVGAVPPAQPRVPRAGLRKLLYVGSDEAWQGLPVLLEAMRALQHDRPQLRLSVVGIAADRMRALDPPANVDAIGWVDRAAIADLYRDHDLFVIPRPSTPLTETVIPMKSVEALVHHIPILASRLGAIVEVTGEDAAVLVEPGDAGALREGIVRIAARPEETVRLADAAAGRAQEFAWSAVGSRIVDSLFGPGSPARHSP